MLEVMRLVYWDGLRRGKGDGGWLPAILELVADVLEIGVAHVVDGKDEAILVFGDAFANVLKELLLLLARLLGHLGEVEDLGAF
jgi:hypothetical protein